MKFLAKILSAVLLTLSFTGFVSANSSPSATISVSQEPTTLPFKVDVYTNYKGYRGDWKISFSCGSGEYYDRVAYINITWSGVQNKLHTGYVNIDGAFFTSCKYFSTYVWLHGDQISNIYNGTIVD